MPYWRAHQAVPWDRVIATARSLGERQFDFSAKRGYRELGMSKKKAEGDYCALFAHEFDTPLTPDELTCCSSFLWSREGTAQLVDFS